MIVSKFDSLEVEKQITEVKKRIETVNGLKNQYTLKMSLINSRLKVGRLPDDEFATLQEERNECKKHIYELSERIIGYKNEVRELSTTQDEIKAHIEQEDNLSDILRDIVLPKLISLRDGYMAFSSDNTRVSSTRIMASKFSEELNIVIKQINRENP